MHSIVDWQVKKGFRVATAKMFVVDRGMILQ